MCKIVRVGWFYQMDYNYVAKFSNWIWIKRMLSCVMIQLTFTNYHAAITKITSSKQIDLINSIQKRAINSIPNRTFQEQNNLIYLMKRLTKIKPMNKLTTKTTLAIEKKKIHKKNTETSTRNVCVSPMFV